MSLTIEKIEQMVTRMPIEYGKVDRGREIPYATPIGMQCSGW